MLYYLPEDLVLQHDDQLGAEDDPSEVQQLTIYCQISKYK